MKMAVDCLIIGGGIAGLFLLARLREAGYSAFLLEKNALGKGQTIASQGMIHGGMKYALQGFLSPSARAISKMPETWRSLFQEQGTLSFPKNCLLKEGQALFSSGKVTSKITQFFGAKALASHVKLLSSKDYPQVLQNPAYQGSVYELQEWVIDVPAVLQHFRKQYHDALIKISDFPAAFNRNQSGDLESVTVKLDDGTTLTCAANQFFCTAGEGNLDFLNLVPHLKMQKRPLRMVMVKAPTLSPLYGHAMMGGVNPEITLSSHWDPMKNCVWYIGGQLAESGVERSSQEQAIETKKMLVHIFPWIDWHDLSVASFLVSRAEEAMPNGARPDFPSFATHKNITVAWPTKLAFSPLLADKIIEKTPLKKQHAMPTHSFQAPDVAKAPWQDEMMPWLSNI